MPGFLENPFAYIARSDMFVLSSVWEGLPTVLIEAMALGPKLVSTNCPSGPWEILEGGLWGELVPVKDPEALAKAIEKTLDTPKSEYNEKKELSLQRFMLATAIDTYEDIITQLTPTNEIIKKQKTPTTIWKNMARNITWAKSQLSRKKYDVVLVTMQRSGTHWLRMLIAKALVDYFDIEYDFHDFEVSDIVPLFRARKNTGHELLRKESIRIRFGHIPYAVRFRPFLKNKKIILLIRDLRDALTSHYVNAVRRGAFKKNQIPFSLFLRDQKGVIHPGVLSTLSDNIEFLNSWGRYAATHSNNVLIVRYKELHEQTAEQLKDILTLFGIHDVDDMFLKNVIDFCSLENMKQIEEKSGHKEKVIHKGIVGGWKKQFAPYDVEYFNNAIHHSLRYPFEYTYEEQD